MYFPDLLQLLLLLGDLLLQRLHQETVILPEESFDLLDGKISLLQVLDLHEHHRLVFLIVPVACPLVHLRGSQQADPVVVAQGLGVASAEPGESLDCDHISYLPG